jgi:hypothetical protein
VKRNTVDWIQDLALKSVCVNVSGFEVAKSESRAATKKGLGRRRLNFLLYKSFLSILGIASGLHHSA